MAAIHLRVQARGLLLFEKCKRQQVQGAASNIFGTLERSKFIFRNTLQQVQQLIDLKTILLKLSNIP